MAKSTKKNNKIKMNTFNKSVRRGKKSNRVSSKKRSSKRGKTKQMGGFGKKKVEKVEQIDAGELNKLVKTLNEKYASEAEQAAREASYDSKFPNFDGSRGYNANYSGLDLEQYRPEIDERIEGTYGVITPEDRPGAAANPRPTPGVITPYEDADELPQDGESQLLYGDQHKSPYDYIVGAEDKSDASASDEPVSTPFSKAVAKGAKKANLNGI
jgi:hypothetical protein